MDWKEYSFCRQVAAKEIGKLIQEVRSSSPNETIFAIGHSHGGSAIAYFLKRRPELAKRLAGCAFLSTPFVAIRPRPHPVQLLLLISYLPFIVSLFLWSAINIPLGSKSRGLGTLGVLPPRYWLGLILVALVLLIGRFLFKRCLSIEHAVANAIRQQTADVPEGNYVFLRCSGDEAAAALSTAQFVAWLGVKCSSILDRCKFDRIIRPPTDFEDGFRIFVLSAIFPGLLIGTYLQIPPAGLFPHIAQLYEDDGVISVAFYMLTLLLLVFVLCALVSSLLAAFIIVVTQALMSWSFGWTRLHTGFLVELAIEPVPFGPYSLIHIDWNSNSSELTGIVHSWTYAHPIAILHLQDWVRKALAAHANEAHRRSSDVRSNEGSMRSQPQTAVLNRKARRSTARLLGVVRLLYSRVASFHDRYSLATKERDFAHGTRVDRQGRAAPGGSGNAPSSGEHAKDTANRRETSAIAPTSLSKHALEVPEQETTPSDYLTMILTWVTGSFVGCAFLGFGIGAVTMLFGDHFSPLKTSLAVLLLTLTLVLMGALARWFRTTTKHNEVAVVGFLSIIASISILVIFLLVAGLLIADPKAVPSVTIGWLLVLLPAVLHLSLTTLLLVGRRRHVYHCGWHVSLLLSLISERAVDFELQPTAAQKCPPLARKRSPGDVISCQHIAVDRTLADARLDRRN